MQTRSPAGQALPDPDERLRPFLDALVAAGVVGLFWVPPALDADRPLPVAGLVLAAVVGAAMVLRRRLPASATAAAGIATVVGAVLGVCEDPMLATAWCLYSLAIARARRTRAFVLVLVCVIAGLATVTGVPEEGVGGAGQRLLLASAALSVAWLLGATVAGRIAAAREAERARVQLEVAREVHDVVGHALGVIGAEAGVTRALPDAGEQELRDSLAGIEAHARSALEEMQALVRTLRSSPAPLAGREDAGGRDAVSVPDAEPRGTGATSRGVDAGEREAVAGIAQLPSVVAATRGAGVGVDARIDVNGHVDPAIGAVVLRIVQEGLSNVVRHAGGAGCAVDVHRDGDVIVANVRDHGPGARPDGGSGFGLLGMRERARLVSGTVTWRNHPEGGFEVTARLPLREVS
ncbi:sensor histidine kinase [Streptosporangium sp. NPDC050855]|uniref:sensor histidine kinase n=1 Tax=Streptosporangium sp. NPDC050855 TaxID=3366194 RepID=UPI0037B9DC88